MGCIVHGVTKGQTRLSNFHFHYNMLKPREREKKRGSLLQNLKVFIMTPNGSTWVLCPLLYQLHNLGGRG